MTKNKVQEEKIFNQHSALTTFKVADGKKGKYFDSNAEKTVLALLMKGQEDLKKSYRKKLGEILKSGELLESNIKYLSSNMFKVTTYGEELSTNVDISKASKLLDKIYNIKVKELDKIKDEKEREKVYKREKLGTIKELTEMNTNSMSLEYQNRIITEIKDYAKELAIKDNLDSREVDLTAIANDLELNVTRIKKGLEKGVDTAFKFNYIDKKNLDVDVTSTFITSVEIKYDRKEKVSWLSYQIPKSILKLLLVPSIYIPVHEVVIKQVEGNYTLRMHGLLKDHLLRGVIELTREELYEFFMLPSSYGKKTHLVEKFLKPTLKEVEKVSGIECKFEFLPENKFKKIKFFPKLKNHVKAEKIKVLSKEESIKLKKNRKTTLQEGDIADAINNTKKKNIYVSKAWNKRVDNKLLKILKKDGERFTIYVLDELRKSLKEEVKTTLVQYINGMLKNMSPDDLEDESVKKTLEKVEVIKPEIVKETIDEKKLEKVLMDDILYKNFLNWPDIAKEPYIEKAQKMYLEDTGSEKFNTIHEKIFKTMEKIYIIKIIKGE